MGIDKFENTDDLINLALLYSNMGRLYRHVSYYSSQYMISYGEFIKDEDFTNKVRFDTVMKCLKETCTILYIILGGGKLHERFRRTGQPPF